MHSRDYNIRATDRRNYNKSLIRTYKYLRSHLFRPRIIAFYSHWSIRLNICGNNPFIHRHINSTHTHTLFHSRLHSYYWKLIRWRCPINHSTSGRRTVQGRDRKWSVVAFGSVNPIHCAFPPGTSSENHSRFIPITPVIFLFSSPLSFGPEIRAATIQIGVRL